MKYKFLVMIFIIELLDIITTVLAISVGAIEANPFMNIAVNHSITTFTIFKMIPVIFAYLIFYHFDTGKKVNFFDTINGQKTLKAFVIPFAIFAIPIFTNTYFFLNLVI